MSNFNLNDTSLNTDLTNITRNGINTIRNIAGSASGGGGGGGGITSVNSDTGPTVNLITDDIPEGVQKYVSSVQKDKIDTSLQPGDKGVANGIVPLNAQTKIDNQYLNIVQSGLIYKGLYNANTNSPTVSDGNIGDNGFYYIISIAGSHPTIIALANLNIGDQIFNENGTWSHVDLSINHSTETYSGTIEIATQIETNAGTVDHSCITPLKLANYTEITNKINTNQIGVTIASLDGAFKLTPSQKPNYILNDMTDVDTSGALDGQYLKYNSLTTSWSPHTDSHLIADLDDTNITLPLNSQALVYDTITSKWINSNIPRTLSSQNDVDLTIDGSTDSSHLLFYDGIDTWKNRKLTTTDISNFNILTPSNNQILKYNTATNKWINVDIDAVVIDDASETVKGIIELATQVETNVGADALKAVTPATLSNYTGITNKINVNQIGATNGLATLTSGLLSPAQKPQYSLNEMSNVSIVTPLNNQILRYDGTNWENADETVPGEYSAINLGSGALVYKEQISNTFVFRTLLGSPTVSIIQDGNNLTFNSTQESPTLSVNVTDCDITNPQNGQLLEYESPFWKNKARDVITSVGTGQSLYRDKTSNSFNFKSIIAGTNITIQNNANDLTINGSTTVSPYKGSWNPSNTSPVLTNGNGTAGDWYSVTNAAISATPLATSWLIGDVIIYINNIWNKQKHSDQAAANLGTGIGVFGSMTNSVLGFRNIIAGANIIVSLSANDIVITATGLIAGTTVSPLAGQSLIRNAGNTAWVNGFAEMLKAGDATIANIANGDILSYNQTSLKMVNSSRLTRLELDFANKGINTLIASANAPQVIVPNFKAPILIGTESAGIPVYYSTFTSTGTNVVTLNGSIDGLSELGNTVTTLAFVSRQGNTAANGFSFIFDVGAPVIVNSLTLKSTFLTLNTAMQNFSVQSNNDNAFYPGYSSTFPPALVGGSVLLYSIGLTAQSVVAPITITWTNDNTPRRYYKFNFYFQSSAGNFGTDLFFQNWFLTYVPSRYGRLPLDSYTLVRDPTGLPQISLSPPANVKNPVLVDVDAVHNSFLLSDVMPVIRSNERIVIGQNTVDYMEIEPIKQLRLYGTMRNWNITNFTVSQLINTDMNNPIVPTLATNITVFRWSPFNTTRFIQLHTVFPYDYEQTSTFYIRVRFLVNSALVFNVTPVCTICFENVGSAISQEYNLNTITSTTTGVAGTSLFIDYTITPAVSVFVGCTLHLLIVGQAAGYANNSLVFTSAQLIYRQNSLGSSTPLGKN